MHFRIRKNVIQLIRTTYDDSKKKGMTTIIGTVQLAAPIISDNLREQLSAEEISAFDHWLNNQHRIIRLREEIAALSLTENLALAEKWFENTTDVNSASSLVPDIISRWQSFRKVLTKKGLLD